MASNAAMKAWRRANPEKYRAQRERYYQRHGDELRARARANSAKNKRIMNAFRLFVGCERCGYKGCAAALDFHHPGTKRFNVMNRAGASLHTAIQEALDCTILCANCHRGLHAKQLQ